MKRAAIGTWILLGVVFVAGMIALVIQGYHLNRDIDSYINRAQVAAQPEDMAAYVDSALEGMQTYDATTGHTAFIFKTPDNDLALIYDALFRIRERLDFVEKFEPTSTEYQVALDDLRGTLREVKNPATGILWVHGGGQFLLLLIVLTLVAVIASFFWW